MEAGLMATSLYSKGCSLGVHGWLDDPMTMRNVKSILTRQAAKRFLRWCGGGSLMLLVALSAPPLPAAEVSLRPSISIRGEYNDNIDFTRTLKIDDYVVRISPVLDTHYKSDRLFFQGHGALAIIRYLDEERRNTEYQDYSIGGTVKATERLTLKGRGSFTRDETLESELEETGLVTMVGDRTRYGAGGGVSYHWTERSEASLDLDHSQTDYESASYVDYTSDHLSLALNRRLENEKDIVTVKPVYSTYDSDASKVDNYALYLGWARYLTETWRLSCFIGGRYTETSYFFVKSAVVYDPSLLPDTPFRLISERVEESDKSWGGIADISLTKTGETYSGAVGYNRDLSYSSQGDPIERDKLYFKGSRRITQRLSLGLSGSAYQSKSDGKFRQEDSRHLELGTSLRYRLTEICSLNAGYDYSYHKDKTVATDQEYDRNRVWVSLQYRFTKWQ